MQSLRREVMESVIELCSREPSSCKVLVATQCHLRIAQNEDGDRMEDDDREKCVMLCQGGGGRGLRSKHLFCS